ncbi:hypothetical protein JW911_02655 [Candidatus Peregrinibacteria bacterium]|nr:hypothetical protein [Candidatus Peregrinibacteria bacterium]
MFLHKYKNFALGTVFVSPILVHFWTILKYGLNIPFWDDFDTVFSFLIKYLNTNSLFEKLALVFAQHTEHRFALNRIVSLLNYYISNVDFKLLLIIGNLALIGVLIILYRACKVSKNKLFFLIPIPFLLFQPQYNESIFWATAALANFFILLFAFLAIYFLPKNKKKFFILSIIFALCATFTMGNGIFVFLIGLLVLVYQKRYRETIIWFVVTAAVIAFYFYNYINPASHPSLLQALLHPLDIIICFFSLIGAPLASLHPYLLSLSPYFGILIVLYFIYLTYKAYFKKNIVIYSFFLFLLISVFLIAFARSGFGLEQAFSSKYMIVGILFYILSYISLVEIFPFIQKKKYVFVFMIFALVFNVVAYYSNFKYIKDHHDSLAGSMEQWRETKSGFLLYPDQDRANKLLLEAMDKNIYTVN